MVVRTIAISAYDLLLRLKEYADELQPPPGPHIERGDPIADLMGPIPKLDRTRPEAFRFQIMQWSRPAWLPDDCTISSVNYFPPGGSGLGWHTDSSVPGWRVYVASLLADLPGELHHEHGWLTDRPQLAHAFFVDGRPCSSWHAVRAMGARFSVGVRFGPGATARALGLL